MQTRLGTIAIALQLTCAFTGIAAAQQPPPKAREGKVEFALVTTSGNASSQSVGAAAQVTFRPPKWVIDGQTAFVRNKSDNVVSAKSFTARGRASRVLRTRLQVFGQHSYLRDLFSGVAHRNNTEAGLALLALETPRQTFYADAGLGYLNETRTVGERLTAATANAGGRYKLQLSETSDITEELTMSADLSDDGTWRLAQSVALTARVAAGLSLKISNVVRYVGEPVVGFERTDTVTSAALVLSF
jgi:putative salt-induced outer membrane protein YdiY